MQVVFHEAFHAADYSLEAFDNAAEPGRLEGVMRALSSEGGYAVREPAAALREELLLGHGEDYVSRVEQAPGLYRIASLAAGAAFLASDLAMQGTTAFACLRPPGHHASRDSAWGHCTFSNLALALLRLKAAGRIRSAFVVDFDLHTGDGTLDVLRSFPECQVFNTYGDNAGEFLRHLEERLQQAPQVDVLAVSAGFDAYKKDLGRKLDTEDFFAIGRLLQGYAIRLGHQRRFAVLEGGYYLPDLGANARELLEGME